MFARLARRAARAARPGIDGAAPLAAGALPGAEAAARERMRAFALAASDMLLETTPQGVIQFAAGRGAGGIARPEALVGRDIVSLVAPADAAAFALALAQAAREGRMAPAVLRFAGGEAATVSAMLVAGPPASLCFSIGPVPLPPPALLQAQAARAAAAVTGPAVALLRGGGGQLGLVEVAGLEALMRRLPAAAQATLRAGLDAALAEAGGQAHEVAAGRFGIVAGGALALDRVVRRIRGFLAGAQASEAQAGEAQGFEAKGLEVTGLEMALAPGTLAPDVAARVLRYAVTRFTDGGVAAAAGIGAGEGLEAILARAEARSVAMQAALAAHRFRLAYQPVVSLGDRAVHHYEALLRPIATPGLLVEGTQEFVTFAEAVGLSETLDLAVLEQALAGLREAPGVSVAVNVSGLSLQSAEYRARMFAAVEGAAGWLGAAAGGMRLMVELTETSEIEDMQAAAEALARLRAMGVAVCLDDFGMGAAAFRYLQRFRVDYVKVDGSFVHAAMAGGRERALVASMVDLARAGGARTVAEMIETEAQAALMAELGVEQGQGWLFGRPGALPGRRR